MFSQPAASVFVSDGMAYPAALARCTHLGIVAHQDDLEFMALHGILACHGSDDKWFGGVVCTDGAGSPRSGAFAAEDDEGMCKVRRREQDRAAEIGEYGVMIQLGYPGAVARTPGATPLVADLREILDAVPPGTIYTHNPADKHPTHIGVLAATLAAIRALPSERRPARLLGGEVWRGLDWLPDAEKILLDVGGRDAFVARLHGVFESQIAGGKRYDLAVTGRMRANATFFDPHAIDDCEMVSLAMDLTPLVRDDALSAGEFVGALLDRFREDVLARLRG